MLTAQNDEIDKVLGLELGADDYMVKPFSTRELAARLKALIRRSELSATGQNSNSVKELTPLHNIASQRIMYHGVPIDLTRFEYGIFTKLLDAKGGILSREQLLDAVWGGASESLERTVDTHIKTLRQKLRGSGVLGQLIQTHRGMGYSITAILADI
jgi:two-component system catabolic regulation response regulator CreB